MVARLSILARDDNNFSSFEVSIKYEKMSLKKTKRKMGSINCVEMSLNVGAPIDILFNGCNVSMHDVHVCKRHLKLDDKNRSRVLSRLSVIRAFV